MGYVQTDPLKAAKQAKTGKRRKKAADATKFKSLCAIASTNDLTPSFPVTEIKIATLDVPTKRLRIESSELHERLGRSIATDGQVMPIVIWGHEVLDGVARLIVMKEMGATFIKAIDLSHMSRTRALRIAIAINRTGQIADWDVANLREALIVIETEFQDLGATGFTTIETDIIKLDDLDDGMGELDQLPPEQPGPAVCQLGDLFQLGEHRLLVADATHSASYDMLLQGQMVALALPDFPYNVPIAGNVSGLGAVEHADFVMGCGELSNDDFKAFLGNVLERIKGHLIPGGVIEAFMDWRSVHLLIPAGLDAGLTLINVAVWNKHSGGMGAFLRSKHELVPIFCNGPKLATNNVKLGANGRDRSNVWDYPGANTRGSSASKALHSHPTPKSVELIVDAMLDVTNPGDIVLDPFLGSGTTIIAAEECQRVAYGLELDPKYADVIIRRFEAATGQQAIMTETGETFAEVAARRGGEP